MKKVKVIKMALAVLATAALAVASAYGVRSYLDYRAGLPVLKGKCYMLEGGIGLIVADVAEVKDPKTGKEVQVYVGILLMGPFQVEQALDIRIANKELPAMVKDGSAEEVNCGTGQPLSK